MYGFNLLKDWEELSKKQDNEITFVVYICNVKIFFNLFKYILIFYYKTQSSIGQKLISYMFNKPFLTWIGTIEYFLV